MSLSVLACFCCSIPNIVFEWSVYFMVFWPLLGLLVSLFAGAFACSTPPEEMFYLLAADFLLIILCFRSLVAPN